MEAKKIIPIVFATDDGYAPYLGVALFSLIANTSPTHEYHIHILYTRLSNTHKKRLLGLEQEHVSISFLDISGEAQSIGQFASEAHWTIETMYRLFIPELFPHYDKVLYLDCDILLLADVAELYSLDMGDAILGVGRLAEEKKMVAHLTQDLQVEPQDGFIAGVLLINCTQFKSQHIKDQCFQLLQEDWSQASVRYTYPDQDALILTCRGQLSHFPMHWNFEWYLCFEDKMTFSLSEQSQLEYEQAKQNLKLIHFTSPWKAWDSPDCEYAELFWASARETVFYEEILFKEMRPKPIPKNKAFPWTAVSPGSLVVLYGAGHVGRAYLAQIAMTSYCHVVAVCDQNAALIHDLPLPVVTPRSLSEVVFDSIVIAVEDKVVSEKIRENLEELGVLAEKILWK